MFSPAVAASTTGRVEVVDGCDADACSRAHCERSVYRRSRGLARLGSGLVAKSHGKKQSTRRAVVIVAGQAAREQSRITTTATGMVGRLLTAAAAQISECSPTPHLGTVPGSLASVAGRPGAPKVHCRYLDPSVEKGGALWAQGGSDPAPGAESPVGPVTR